MVNCLGIDDVLLIDWTNPILLGRSYRNVKTTNILATTTRTVVGDNGIGCRHSLFSCGLTALSAQVGYIPSL